MCRSNIEKETVFLNQNSVGANKADFHELKEHISVVYVVLIILCVLMGLGAVYLLYQQYKKCHHSWINEAMAQNYFRRSSSRSRANREDERDAVKIQMK